MSTNDFTQVIRSSLSRALREYMCRKIALNVNKPDNWYIEVIGLLKKVKEYMDPIKTKTTFKNRDVAFKEALNEVPAQLRVSHAKDKIIGYYPELLVKVDSMQFDGEKELRNMINEFLPEFKHLI